MHTRNALWVVILLAPLATGCLFVRSGDDGGTSDAGTNDAGNDGGGGTVEGPSAPGSCSDNIDNDGDSFTDCQDFDCDADPACVVPDTLTLYDIQDTTATFHPNAGSEVAVDGVIVTAVRSRTNAGTSFWDAFVMEKAGGPFSGIPLFGLTSAVAEGDEVNFIGIYDEFFDMSQVTNVSSLTIVSSGQSVPTPQVVAPADLTTDSAEAEQWEGVLVEVQNVTVTDALVEGSDGLDHGDFEVTGNLVIGDEFRTDYRGLRTLGDSFDSIVGIHWFSFGVFRVQPRRNEDLTYAGGGNPGPLLQTIYEVQDEANVNHPPDGTAVEFQDVVITALAPPDFNGRVSFAVQDAAGGAFSGIYVYNRANADMTSFSVGDTVNVSGAYTEFSFNGDTDTVSEISLTSITAVGTGAVPAPVPSDPASLSVNATAEEWEGVLVEVTNVTVSAGTNNFGEFTLEGGLKVDDLFIGSMNSYGIGDTFDRITGVLHYNFGYSILPRSAADIVEGTIIGPTLVSVNSIQDTTAGDHPVLDSQVRVEGAVVTSVQPRTGGGVFGFTMQQGTGPYSGIFVFLPSAVDPGSLTIGDTITSVEGIYKEYFDLTEISASALTVGAPGTVPTPELLTDPTLFAGSSAEQWEGVLVTVDKGGSKMVVDADPDQYNEWTVDSEVLAVDDSDADNNETNADPAYFYQATAGEQIQSITGVVDYAFGHYRLWLRSSADVVP